MFSSFELQLLSVRDYSSKTKAQQNELLPEGPGIYVWTIDLGYLADPGVPDAGQQLFDRVKLRLRPVKYEVGARIGRYHRATLRVEPTELTSATRRRLEDLEAAKTDLLEWSLLCGTLFQRPLYVGKAVSLRRRIQDHLKGGSRLRTYLEEVGLEASDCTVLLASVRAPDEPYGGDVAQALEAEVVNNEDDLVTDDEEEEVAASAPPALVEIDKLVRLAESLTIRLSHPLLNRKQD
jgi:hypothetical protein